MIEPMSKIQFIFHSSSWQENMSALQDLGLLDINFRSISTESKLGEEYMTAKKAVDALLPFAEYKVYRADAPSDDKYHGVSVLEVAQNICGMEQQKTELEKEITEMNEVCKELSCLGVRVGSEDIEIIEKQLELDIKIYKSSKTAVQISVPEDVYLDKLYSNKMNSYWVLISPKDLELSIPNSWAEYKLPKSDVTHLEAKIEFNKKEIEGIHSYIISQLEYLHTLQVKLVELENTLVRETIINASEKFEDCLMLVEGFVPRKDQHKIEIFAEEHGCGITIDEPKEEEPAPTLLRMPWFVRIIKPLFKLMDTTPGYREFDISGLFLLFISLFYAMIIGDAGYGSLMFVVTLLFTISAAKSKKVQLVHALMLWFSFVTIVWGALTGNWFGYLPISEIPFFKQFVYQPIAISNKNSDEIIKIFCFRIGLTHLLIAHFWKSIRMFKESFLLVIHELAQAAFLYGLYYVVLFLLLDPIKYPLPSYTTKLILISFGVIVLTSEQQKGQNIFVGMGKGLSSLFTLFLGGVGALADLISYIRLFAVGLASLAIANAFNEMGVSVMTALGGASLDTTVGIAGIIVGSLVIALGHTLNLAMALLAVMVHGVRLNMLEFGMHLGMEWTGRVFSPLKKKFLTLEENK